MPSVCVCVLYVCPSGTVVGTISVEMTGSGPMCVLCLYVCVLTVAKKVQLTSTYTLLSS